MDKENKTSSGIKVTWGAEHRDANGKLIVRMCSLDTPEPLTCLKIKCIISFMEDCLRTALISMYHQRRIAYAEKNQDKKILERYRTGEPAPKNIVMALIANTKLACPVCRSVETKYW